MLIKRDEWAHKLTAWWHKTRRRSRCLRWQLTGDLRKSFRNDYAWFVCGTLAVNLCTRPSESFNLTSSLNRFSINMIARSIISPSLCLFHTCKNNLTLYRFASKINAAPKQSRLDLDHCIEQMVTSTLYACLWLPLHARLQQQTKPDLWG